MKRTITTDIPYGLSFLGGFITDGIILVRACDVVNGVGDSNNSASCIENWSFVALLEDREGRREVKNLLVNPTPPKGKERNPERFFAGYDSVKEASVEEEKYYYTWDGDEDNWPEYRYHK